MPGYLVPEAGGGLRCVNAVRSFLPVHTYLLLLRAFLFHEKSWERAIPVPLLGCPFTLARYPFLMGGGVLLCLYLPVGLANLFGDRRVVER